MKKSDYGKEKKCPRCTVVLSIKKFSWNKSRYASWCKQCTRDWNINHRTQDPRVIILYAASKRAKAKGIPCSITLDDIVIPKFCPVLGLPLKKGVGEILRNSPSLDRIRLELGYVPGNVQVVSNKANAMKSDATLEELVALGEWAKRLLIQGV